MNYETASDFEINKAVAEALGYETGWKAAGCSAIGIAHGGAFGRYVDYCNKPEDAWPVIYDNRISIVNPGGEWSVFKWDFEDGARGSNPLRAAMVVFLQMQESATE